MGVRVLSISKLPLPSIPNGENTNKFQCWGVGEDWLPKPWRDAQVHKTRTGLLHTGQWKGSLKERYSNTKATVEHNTMGKGWVREEIKKKRKPSGVCPELPWLPRSLGLV